MNISKSILLFLVFFIAQFISLAQAADDYYDSKAIRYEDYTYRKNIKTVLLTKANWEFSAPVLSLGSGDQLQLSFDDLDSDSKNYRYTVIHCDASWNPSDRLLQSEYIEGFYDNGINDYQYSKNTLQKYVHYELLFPNENMKLTKSGNYILKVYLDYDANQLVLTKRFMVADERVNILPDIHHASIVEEYNYKQEIDFSIQTPGYQIINPYNDLKVVITQNDRWDNAITKLKPLFIKNDELVYDYDRDNVFSGGNEFRNFDIKSIHWNSEFVKNIYRDSSSYHVILYPGKKRSYFQYLSDRDINGKYKIARQESSANGSVTEAEYVYVHVSLATEQVENGNIYILGGFNNWRYSNENKMHYNKDLKQYEIILYLKQGYYNYLFTYLKDGEQYGDETLIEGQHYETENEYCIYVYYKPITSNYDQLIGVKRFNSMHY